MKIIQISDIHIGADYDGKFKTHENFELVMEDIKKEKDIDLIVVTGDLTDDNYIENYLWVKQKLDATGIHYLVLSGNHDDGVLLKKIFGQFACFNETRKIEIEENVLIFIDTSSGKLSIEAFDALESHSFVFTHFPILDISHNFMNNGHSLEDIYGVTARIIRSGLQNTKIFCGHYHYDLFKSYHYDDIKLYVCPSTQAQLDSRTDSLVISSYSPGYRIIRSDSFHEFETEVVFLNR